MAEVSSSVSQTSKKTARGRVTGFSGLVVCASVARRGHVGPPGPVQDDAEGSMSAGAPPRTEDAARHLAEALRALGVEGPHLEGTPARVAELWAELLGGASAADELVPFPNPDPSGNSIVLAAGLPFHAMCAHH